MAIETYKKKIEDYIKNKDKKPSAESSKGLLSPKESMSKPMGNEQDPVQTIGEFVYTIRQKRAELISKGSKK